MVAALLIIIAVMVFSLLSGKQQREFISSAVGTAGFLIKATWWISGLFVAPFFALIAYFHYNKELDTFYAWFGFICAGIGFLFWQSLIKKIKDTKENTDK